MCEVVSKTWLKNLFFPKNPLFSNMCIFYAIVLKRKNITGSMFKFINAEMAKTTGAKRARKCLGFI